MKKNERKIEDFFKAKYLRRKRLAALSIEKKIKILVELQTIASAVYSTRNLKKQPWKL